MAPVFPALNQTSVTTEAPLGGDIREFGQEAVFSTSDGHDHARAENLAHARA